MSRLIYPNPRHLIPRSKSPHCYGCGRRLWKVHWEKHYDPEHPSKRLGRIPVHRPGPRCFNVKRCVERMVQKEAGAAFRGEVEA